ncbi:MAG: DUF2336 domain-containing protein [Pseudomonadota bacterium]
MLEKFQRLAESNDGNSQAVMVLQLADLFVSDDTEASSTEKHNFDYIIKHVTKTISADVTARIAERIARTNRVASATAAHLAANESADIAVPVLQHSPVLLDEDLIQIARTRSESHRVAIAGREIVAEAVSEVLSEVGGERTLTTLADNEGAQLNSNALNNMLRRAAPNSIVPKRLAERATNNSALGDMVRKTLGAELREKLEDAGLKLPDNSFEEISAEAKLEVDRQVKAERLHMVDAMVARNKIANNQATLDLVIKQALQKDAFLLATRILAMQSHVAYEHLLRAFTKERAEPLAILCRAGGVELQTFQTFELARCDYFDLPVGDMADKLDDMRRVSEQQAQEFLQKIQETLAA